MGSSAAGASRPSTEAAACRLTFSYVTNLLSMLSDQLSIFKLRPTCCFNDAMHRRHLGLAFIAAAWLRALGANAAESPGTAGAFIQQLGRELTSVVGDAATVAEKRLRLEPFLARIVDVEALARFCVGRYWRQATPEQQQEYLQLFLVMLTNTVASRVGVYSEGTSKVTVMSEIAKSDGVYVPTIVQTGSGPPVHVTWVLDTGVSPYRILDVQVEGMSMRLSQRSDYTSFLSHNAGDFNLFLRALRERAH
jgi:phospholipid transport system substrate-binding protein